jgi:hypothetical protein
MHAEITGGGDMNNSYGGPDRRTNLVQVVLTDDQLDQIAERAAEKAVAKMTGQAYQAIGQGVVKKGLYIIGVAAVLFYGWAVTNGWITPKQ